MSSALPSGEFVDTLPAIRLRETQHPRHDRRAVNLRWLIATTFMAVAAAALLGGVLQAGLHRAMKIRPAELAQAPAPARIAAADGRADRLTPRGDATPARPSPLSTQHLRSTGLGDRPLTVLVADLAHMSALPPVPSDTAPAVEATPAGDQHDQAVPHGPAGLPALVAFGSTRPTGAGRASSYAAMSIPAWAEPGPFGTALNVTIRAGSAPGAPDRASVIVGQRGDTLDRVLTSFGVSAANVAELNGALGVDRLAGGERIVVRQAGDQPAAEAGRPIEVRLERPGGVTRIAALSDAGHYLPVLAAETTAGTPVADAAATDGGADDATLRDGIGALAGHDGVGRPLVADILRVLGTDLDLGEDVAAADRIEVLYGAAEADGSGEQELDYAALTAGGKTTRLYRFAAQDDNSVDYYDEAGHSLTKFLLRKPVAAGRLGDGFGWRTHPILGDRRFHEGVDYAAPYGSPIVAAGAGVVEKIDYESGYGKYIRIRHDLGYETTYAHVAGYPRGIAVGKRVQQGETIALIGSTGLSTGPHLYYEVKINDRNVDPTRIKIAAGRILEGQALASFEQRRNRIDVLVRASRPSSS